MTHLGHDEILRWRDEGAEAERSRVLGHLAACATCRLEYADLVRDAEPAGAAGELAAEAIPRGLQAYHPAGAQRARFGGWSLWAVSAMAAALLVGTAVLLVVPRPASDTALDNGVRGDEIQILSPVGTVPGPIAFRWSSPVRSSRFRVWVHDGTGAVVYSALSAVEQLRPPPEAQARLQAGQTYKWQVEALDAGGELLARSPEQRFTIER